MIHRGSTARLPLAILLTAGIAWPSLAVALEPRFDHRDQHMVLAELGLAHDSLVVGGLTSSGAAPTLRLAWGFDLSGEGDELQLGGTMRLGSWSDPGRVRSLASLDARYRSYFGLEELKTFVEVGVWAGLASRLAGGGLAGVGLAYDPSRAWGIFVAARFAGGFGQARVASLSGGAGLQLRW